MILLIMVKEDRTDRWILDGGGGGHDIWWRIITWFLRKGVDRVVLVDETVVVGGSKHLSSYSMDN